MSERPICHECKKQVKNICMDVMSAYFGKRVVNIEKPVKDCAYFEKEVLFYSFNFHIY